MSKPYLKYPYTFTIFPFSSYTAAATYRKSRLLGDRESFIVQYDDKVVFLITHGPH